MRRAAGILLFLVLLLIILFLILLFIILLLTGPMTFLHPVSPVSGFEQHAKRRQKLVGLDGFAEVLLEA